MPDLLWWNFGVPAAMVGLFVFKFLFERDQRVKTWEKSTKAICRDHQVKTSGFLAPRAKVTTRSGPNEVQIRDCRTSPKSVVVEIEGPEGFSTLKLRPQGFGSRVREIEVGDETFDGKLIIEGPTLSVGLRLDETTRSRILSAVSSCASFEIGGGTLRAEVKDENLRRVLPILFGIGQQLAKPLSVDRQLARNALEDESPGVRLFNLLLLARERPGEPGTLDVLRQACEDKSPKVRLRAAIELGEEGRPILLKLAEKSVDDEAAAQAVSHLGDTLPFESLRKVLLRSRDEEWLRQTALAALEELGRRGTEAIGLLSRAVAKGSGDLAAAAARALGATGDASAEAPLLQALRSEDGMLREAAAVALGKVGTVAAVPLLKEAGEVSWLARDLRRTVRQAIAEIQSRLEGLPGQLSLAEVEGGALSLASDDAGQLSLAPESAREGGGELALLPHGAGTGGPTEEGRRQRVRR